MLRIIVYFGQCNIWSATRWPYHTWPHVINRLLLRPYWSFIASTNIWNHVCGSLSTMLRATCQKRQQCITNNLLHRPISTNNLLHRPISTNNLLHRPTRQSEMANTSPATCQCLATFTPLKSKMLIFFSWRHFSARSSCYIINWYGYPRGSHEKYLKETLSVQFLRYAIELLHVKRRTRQKWR